MHILIIKKTNLVCITGGLIFKDLGSEIQKATQIFLYCTFFIYHFA